MVAYVGYSTLPGQEEVHVSAHQAGCKAVNKAAVKNIVQFSKTIKLNY
jgi:hypothetical protein